MAAKKNKISIVDPGPQLTIDFISQIHKSLLEAIEKKQEVVIKTKSIDNIDLTGIQFIIFAKKFAREKKVPLSFDLKISDRAEKLIMSCGFNNLL